MQLVKKKKAIILSSCVRLNKTYIYCLDAYHRGYLERDVFNC